MRDLPSGTVTFLFTDIEGSTRLLRELGDRYADALAAHRRTVRDACGAFQGVEVDTQGDAFFFAFARASDALAAAARAQRDLAAGPVRVRMGIHTGEPMLTDEGYVGADVHAGARIAACAHGGQVVVSRRTRELAGGGEELGDLGEHRLKDLPGPVRLFQLGDGEFPPLRSLSPTNLPRPASSFVGREPALAEASELLAGSRLVTITGPGGCGKTRFGIELAHRALEEYPDGVWWVALAPLRDPRLVLAGAEQASGARGDLAAHAAGRRMLIVLDNFEHVMGAAADLAELIRDCPALTVLVTSRELLRIEGEQEYALPGMSGAESSALFCDRAHAQPTTDVDQLCRSLEGLPLAIELAAARAGLLSPTQIMERLSQRLDLFRGGRDADPRHATLRATIEWSEELLDAPEKAALARFAVFAGGATFEAVEAVTGAGPDSVQSLLQKSLLRRSGDRLLMLETIRQYAFERLQETGEGDAIRERHARHYLAVAESVHLSDHAPGEPRHDVALAEHGNFRTALDWLAEDGDVELGLRLLSALETLWVITDPEGALEWFRVLLDRAGDEVPAGVLGNAYRVYGSVTNPAGDDNAAERLYTRSLAEYRRAGDEDGATSVLVRLGHSAWYRGDLATAERLAREVLAGSRRTGSGRSQAQALGLLGDLACERGEYEEGLELLRQSVDVAVACGFLWWQARMLLRSAKRAHEIGKDGDAAAWAREALQMAISMSERRRILQLLDLLGAVAAAQGEQERAGVLRGAVAAELERDPVPAWSPVELPAGSAATADFERGTEAGCRLSVEDAAAYALSPPSSAATERSRAPRSYPPSST
jgi:predicted ATPase/class 3 adenylate cyclase